MCETKNANKWVTTQTKYISRRYDDDDDEGIRRVWESGKLLCVRRVCDTVWGINKYQMRVEMENKQNKHYFFSGFPFFYSCIVQITKTPFITQPIHRFIHKNQLLHTFIIYECFVTSALSIKTGGHKYTKHKCYELSPIFCCCCNFCDGQR